MCILCVIQKWSRRIATTLPWLVIPLIGLWALSQLLPPTLRFEVTSPRLACVFVLLVTLFWYEILMPQLSAWRVRRSARIREKRRFEAMELQKLRKTATRRCRNCLTLYREQNPAGGRFMCSYCGHISRRPVLDIPSGILSCKNTEGIGNLAIVGDLVAKGGRIWNGKVLMERQGCNGSGNRWFCGDWSENGTWSGGTFLEKSSYWGKNGTIFDGGLLGCESRCLREKSYSDFAMFGERLLGSLVASIRWLSRKCFRFGSSADGAFSDSESSSTSRKGEGGLGFPETKGEKARRKAEEKRQARLEKEMLEEEERKQREEVARLVEERRKLRDEKTAAERVYTKGSTPEDRESKREREIERKKHERTREKEQNLNTERSISEGEEVERRSRKENEKKRDFDRKGDNERRDLSKFYMNNSLEGKSADSLKAHGSDMGHGCKGSINHASKIGASRYFERMRGSFVSQPKAIGGSSLSPLIGRGAQTDAQNVSTKVSKPVMGDHAHAHANEGSFQQTKGTSTSVWDGMLRTRLRAEVIDGSSETSPKRSNGCRTGDVQLNEYSTGKQFMNGDGKSLSVVSQLTMQAEKLTCTHMTAPKNSWQCLSTRTKTTPGMPTVNPDLQLNSKHIQLEGETYHSQDHNSPYHPLHGPLSSSSAVPAIPCSSMAGCSMPMHMFEASHFPMADHFSDITLEGGETFDDPAYVTDPVSLLGPVSESLDNFSLDIGMGFMADTVPEKSLTTKKLATLGDVVWPSPIECPVPKLSLQGCSDEANSGSGQFPDTPKSCNSNSNIHEQGTWKMWDTPPIVQEGLGLIGGPAWLLPTLNITPLNQGISGPPCAPRASLSHFTNEDQPVTCSHSPDNFSASYGLEGRTYDLLGTCLVGEDPWQQKVLFGPPSDVDGQFGRHHLENSNKDVSTQTAMRPAEGQELSPGSCWPRNEWAVHPHLGQGGGQAPQTRVQTGGLFSPPDVQSLWSYK